MNNTRDTYLDEQLFLINHRKISNQMLRIDPGFRKYFSDIEYEVIFENNLWSWKPLPPISLEERYQIDLARYQKELSEYNLRLSQNKLK